MVAFAPHTCFCSPGSASKLVRAGSSGSEARPVLRYHDACAAYADVARRGRWQHCDYNHLKKCLDDSATRPCAVCGGPGASVPCRAAVTCGGSGGGGGSSSGCALWFHYPCARVATAAGGGVLFADGGGDGRGDLAVACSNHHSCILEGLQDPGEQQFAGLW